MASPCRPACGTWSLISNQATPGVASGFTRADGFVVTFPRLAQLSVYTHRYVFVRHHRPFFSGCPQHSMTLNQPRLPLQSRDSCVQVSAVRTLAERHRILGARVAPRFDGSLLEDKPNRKRSLQMDNDFNPIDPDSRNAGARRIVEGTDHDESLFPEFIELDAFALEARRPQ